MHTRHLKRMSDEYRDFIFKGTQLEAKSGQRGNESDFVEEKRSKFYDEVGVFSIISINK